MRGLVNNIYAFEKFPEKYPHCRKAKFFKRRSVFLSVFFCYTWANSVMLPEDFKGDLTWPCFKTRPGVLFLKGCFEQLQRYFRIENHSWRYGTVSRFWGQYQSCSFLSEVYQTLFLLFWRDIFGESWSYGAEVLVLAGVVGGLSPPLLSSSPRGVPGKTRGKTAGEVAPMVSWPSLMGSGMTLVEGNFVATRFTRWACSRAQWRRTVLFRVKVRGQWGQATRMPWCLCLMWALRLVS